MAKFLNWRGAGASTVRAMAAGAAVASVIGMAGSAWGQADFQFRVNFLNPDPLHFHLMPSEGLATVTAQQNQMVFVWTVSSLAHVPIPVCGRVCDGFMVHDEFGGGGLQVDSQMLMRRFDALGVALDVTDVVLATLDKDTHGPPTMSSTSVRRAPPPGLGSSPFRTVWWEAWSWAAPIGLLPCGRDCDHEPVDWLSDLWPSFTSLAPTSQAGECVALVPSTAVGPGHDLIAWRDIQPSCHLLRYRVDELPVLSGTVLRAHVATHDVDRPCAAVGLNDRFVVAWREIDLATGLSTTDVARVDPPFVAVGPAVVVNNSEGAGPAVAVMDDGSFAVEYVHPRGTIPESYELLVQLFNAASPPAPVGGPLMIAPSYDPALRFTLSARGATITDTAARLATSYEIGDPVLGPVDISGRMIKPATRVVGASVRIPLASTPPGWNVLAEMHQHTAHLRSDLKLATVFRAVGDGNVYCSVRTLPLCPADFNQDGVLSIQDIFDFLAAWFAGDPRADFNGMNGITIQDIFDFLAAWFAGC